MKRKRYSKEFKAKVALAALKGHQTANEIASELGVHAGQVNHWGKEGHPSFCSLHFFNIDGCQPLAVSC